MIPEFPKPNLRSLDLRIVGRSRPILERVNCSDDSRKRDFHTEIGKPPNRHGKRILSAFASYRPQLPPCMISIAEVLAKAQFFDAALSRIETKTCSSSMKLSNYNGDSSNDDNHSQPVAAGICPCSPSKRTIG